MGNLNFNLPESTTFNRRVPKQKFYENCAISAALKRSFVDEITAIWWRNKLAATTLNLAKGTAVTEIEVFEIELANGHLDEEVLRQMDRKIPSLPSPLCPDVREPRPSVDRLQGSVRHGRERLQGEPLLPYRLDARLDAA